jgi:Flp pilus assembly protein TadB
VAGILCRPVRPLLGLIDFSSNHTTLRVTNAAARILGYNFGPLISALEEARADLETALASLLAQAAAAQRRQTRRETASVARALLSLLGRRVLLVAHLRLLSVTGLSVWLLLRVALLGRVGLALVRWLAVALRRRRRVARVVARLLVVVVTVSFTRHGGGLGKRCFEMVEEDGREEIGSRMGRSQ